MKKKLIVPLITPMYKGELDEASLLRLIAAVQDSVDMLVPCLSTGEGQKLTIDQWTQVVRFVCIHASTPVYAGIFTDVESIETYIAAAAQLGCEGIIISLGAYAEQEMNHILHLAQKQRVKVILYNTESAVVKDIPYILRIAANPTVTGFKDSSMDDVFLQQLFTATRGTSMEVYQGMEMAMKADGPDVDGCCIALANVEPVLCATIAADAKKSDWQQFAEIVQIYNLASEQWYVTLKAILFSRHVIRSAEEIHTL